ncbi:hypothetical protein BDA99DRAFT_499022 [Phascolomyces articulosus]|uniref:Uncharacterized protein n=1 Tax=Phascolomyces articulosus TaxID=60185 RepID=A0AAD5PH43_9FUNG|nr:hypothetical protein BDA99DRAFT_499022 [Phascolomyces articulosus]
MYGLFIYCLLQFLYKNNNNSEYMREITFVVYIFMLEKSRRLSEKKFYFLSFYYLISVLLYIFSHLS